PARSPRRPPRRAGRARTPPRPRRAAGADQVRSRGRATARFRAGVRTCGAAGNARPARRRRGRARARAGESEGAPRMTAPRKPRAARGSKLTPDEIVELFTRLRAANPHPTTELEYTTPFELLVAVVLSAQATDVGVNKATRKLFPVANTPAAILALGEDGLKGYINTIGLYNAKAANVI